MDLNGEEMKAGMIRRHLTFLAIASTVASIFLLTSCLPDPLEVDGIPVVKPEIVVSSQIVPDESLVILLTKSFGALDASDDSDPQALLDQISITDALVTLQHNGETDTLLSLGNGFYGGTTIDFVPNTDYTLNVDSESLGNVTATTRVKPQVTFEEIEAQLYFDNFDDTLAQITYRLDDPPEKNWYMLNVLKVEQDELRENLLNPRDFVRLVDDETFADTTFVETFRVFPREFADGDTIAVYLSNISKDYYDFIQLRLDNRFSLVEFISEPLNYPSNVIGGRGYFNLYIPDIRFIVLEWEE
jgi:hypothetical protein